MTLLTNKLRCDLLLTEKLLKWLCSCSSLAQLLQVIFMLHIQLSLEQQYEYVLTKGHAVMGKVTYHPTLVLPLLFIPGQWSLVDCFSCSLFRYTWNANVQNMSTSYSSVRWCYYMTRLLCVVFKIHEARILKCDSTRFRYVSSLGFKWQTNFPVILWPPRYKNQDVLGGNKCDRAPVAFSNTYNQFNVFFNRI
jgi:hypothetical protein